MVHKTSVYIPLFRNSTHSICHGPSDPKPDNEPMIEGCHLHFPAALLLANNTLYIGERGTFHGGLRSLSTKRKHIRTTESSLVNSYPSIYIG